MCGCGAVKLHTTLVALGLFGFLFWVVFLLCFVCGRGFVSHTYHRCHVGQCGCSVGYVDISCGTTSSGLYLSVFWSKTCYSENWFLRFLFPLESFLVKRGLYWVKKLCWFIVLFPLGFCVVLQVLWGLPVGLWVCSCMLGLIRRGHQCSILLVFCIHRRFPGIRRLRICL